MDKVATIVIGTVSVLGLASIVTPFAEFVFSQILAALS